MTLLRKQKDAISNEIDAILEGIGHRGSSFIDIDALTHDMRTHRYLFQEFKRPNEGLSNGQRVALCDLASEPRMTVWYVQLGYGEDTLVWADMRWPDAVDLLTLDQYRERFRNWWENR